MTAPEPVTLWRCHTCGKWSHAIKRPRSHQRAVFQVPAEGVEILSYDPPYYSEYDESESRETWFVKCGPFDEWRAEAVL